MRSDVHQQYLSLPPSLEMGATYVNAIDGLAYMQPLIKYSIEASVLPTESRRHCTAARIASRGINIMPIEYASPPLCTGITGKFPLRSTKILRQHLWSKSLGELEVSAVEPSPLNGLTSAPRASSTVCLKLAFRPQHYYTTNPPPFEWSCEVQYRILAKTFYATFIFEEPPDVYMKSNANIELHSKVVTAEKRSFKTSSWRLDRLSKHGTIVQNERLPWMTRLFVPINAPKTLLPTFLAQLAARKYSLWISVRIRDFYHNQLEVEVPLQVVFDPSDGMSQVAVGSHEGDPYDRSLSAQTLTPPVEATETQSQVCLPRPSV